MQTILNLLITSPWILALSVLGMATAAAAAAAFTFRIDASGLNPSILTSVGDGILCLDTRGLITFANPAASRMAGYAVEELEGRSFHGTLCKSSARDGQTADCALRRVLDDGVHLHAIQDDFHRKDGTTFPAEFTGSPIIQEGRITGAVLVVRDSTERKRTEAELALRERALVQSVDALNHQKSQIEDQITEKTKALLDANTRLQFQAELLHERRVFIEGLLKNVQAGLACLDRSLKYRWVNPALAELVGAPPADLIGKGVFEHSPELEDQLGPIFQRVLEEGVSPPSSRISLGGSDDEERFWDTSHSPLVDDDGTITGILTLLFDVTEHMHLERKVAEQLKELERNRGFIESLVCAFPVAIAYLDRKLGFHWVNPYFADLVGTDPGELIGRSHEEIFPQLAQSRQQIIQAFLTGEPVRGEAIPLPRERGGETVMTYWNAVRSPVFKEDGQIEGVLSLAIDATPQVERERLQHEKLAALTQAKDLKRQFLNTISHELRAPLTVLMAAGNVLRDEVMGPLLPEQRHTVETIIRSSKALLSLVNDMLDMSQLQAGRMELMPRWVCLSDLAQETIADLLHLATQKRQRLTFDTPDIPIEANADDRRIGQVMTNLIMNAIKFTPHEGHITVRLSLEGDTVHCEVEDDGIGIPAEEATRLFQQFSQLESGGLLGGLGLGLSICKAIIEAHGGSIGVREARTRGSIFWFTLPERAASGPARVQA